MDLSASILAATGTTVRSKPGLDGMNIFPILERRAPPVERTLFWRVTRERNQRAVRSGDWKLLIDDGRPFLFDVRKDLGERNNLVGIRTDVVRKLMPLIDKWEADVDAEAKTRS
jgi:arylsulfatase A-like enzyme